VAERIPFLLRLDPVTMAALRTWAGDDLRSLNGQIEFLLRRALRDAGRAPAAGTAPSARTDAAKDRPAVGSDSSDVARADASRGRGEG
jgi:hypothetical protein